MSVSGASFDLGARPLVRRAPSGFERPTTLGPSSARPVEKLRASEVAGPLVFALTSRFESTRTARGLVAVFSPFHQFILALSTHAAPPSRPTWWNFVSAVVVFDLVSPKLCPGVIPFPLLGIPTCCYICQISCRMAVSAAHAAMLALGTTVMVLGYPSGAVVLGRSE